VSGTAPEDRVKAQQRTLDDRVRALGERAGLHQAVTVRWVEPWSLRERPEAQDAEPTRSAPRRVGLAMSSRAIADRQGRRRARVAKLHEAKKSTTEIAVELGVGRNTVLRDMRELGLL
jgi:transcriptional regulator of acetoin/glycerol metabolism